MKETAFHIDANAFTAFKFIQSNLPPPPIEYDEYDPP